MSHLYYIQDDDGQVVLFKPKKIQLDLDESLHHRNVILKARQVGITTHFCIRWLDTCLFQPDYACGIVADTRENAEKFFRNKILFAYERLPEWLKADLPITRKDMTGELVFGNGSRLNVGVSLRSGTYQRVHVSELGPMGTKYPSRAKETVSGTLNAVPLSGIVTVESTAEGAFGAFYDMCQRAKSLDARVNAGTGQRTAMDYKFFFIAWFDDEKYALHEPVYISPELVDYFEKVEAEVRSVRGNKFRLRPEQKAWYAKKAEEQGELMWSQFPSTPEEAFKASTEGTYYGRLMDRAEMQGRICALPFIPGIPVNTFWDIGRNDTTAIWFHQQVGAWHHFIRFYEHSGEGAAFYARKVQEFGTKYGYVYGKHYLPHDAEVKDWSNGENKSRAEILYDLGVKPQVIVPRIDRIDNGIDMVRQSIPKCRFDVHACGEDPPGSGRGGIPSLRAFRHEWNEQMQCWASTPLHDWSSNGESAFRQHAQGYLSTDTQPSTEPKDPRRDTARKSKRSARVARWRVA